MTIFNGAFQHADVFHRTWTIIACTSIVITAVYILRLVGKILYGTCTNKHHLALTDATWDERTAVIILIGLRCRPRSCSVVDQQYDWRQRVAPGEYISIMVC